MTTFDVTVGTQANDTVRAHLEAYPSSSKQRGYNKVVVVMRYQAWVSPSRLSAGINNHLSHLRVFVGLQRALDVVRPFKPLLLAQPA